jgi:nitrite reductase (NADH) small subunit
MSELARVDDIPVEGGLRVEVDGQEIALFKVGEQVYAIDAVCPHAGGPLDEGTVENGVVTCPWHGWQTDVRGGKCITSGEEITCFAVEVREGVVHLKD